MIPHVENQGTILVVDDQARMRESIAEILRHAGHSVQGSASAIEALTRLQRSSFDVIITDLKMPGMDGMEFIRELESRQIDSQVVMVTAHATVASAVEAMRHGAFDYIEKPFDADQIENLVSRALSHGRLAGSRSSMPIAHPDRLPNLIGSSEVMQQLRNRICQIARTHETVLICGESGTGKELVARAIHLASPRATGPLVSLNCPALSPQLMESELFGHERGAFTSADAPRTGRFELADQGTILLDEVTEIALGLQAKLLRVLQERSFERVGSSSTTHVDVRVLASTNRELAKEVREGRFREDLYYRLAVVPLQIPPLRDRHSDIPELVQHFLQSAARRIGKDPVILRNDTLQLFQDYAWPGNIRELENIITRVTVLGLGATVGADQVRPWLIGDLPTSGDLRTAPPANERAVVSNGMNLHDMERKLIEATLDQFDGHRERTARALGIGVRTLTNKLRAYGYAPRAKSVTRVA